MKECCISSSEQLSLLNQNRNELAGGITTICKNRIKTRLLQLKQLSSYKDESLVQLNPSPALFTVSPPIEHILLFRKICWHSWRHTHDFPHSDSLSVWPHLACCLALIQRTSLFPLLLTPSKKLDTNIEFCVQYLKWPSPIGRQKRSHGLHRIQG